MTTLAWPRLPKPDLRPRLAKDALGVLTEAAAGGDDVARLRIGPIKAVVVTDPAIAREVLVERPEDFPKGSRQHNALRPVLGYGLLTSEAELHQRQRRLIQPRFVPARVDPYLGLMVDETRLAMEDWTPGTVDVMPLLNRLAMDIVARMLFGRAMRDEGKLAASIEQVFLWEMRALTSATAPSWMPTPANRRMKAAKARVDERLLELADLAEADGGGLDPLAVPLRRAVDGDGLPMSRSQYLDEIRTLWGAAHETSADAQAWCLDLLARHPEIQEKLTDRVHEVAGQRSLSRADLDQVPYAMQIFKEALRLYPPAAVILRSSRTSTRLGGRLLTAGTPVFVCPYLMQRRSDLFTDPETFDPDRFSPERATSIPKYAFMPFGAGKRTCVGNYMALLEGQALTATIAQRFRVAPVTPDPPRAELIINLRPAEPVLLRLEPHRLGSEGSR